MAEKIGFATKEQPSRQRGLRIRLAWSGGRGDEEGDAGNQAAIEDMRRRLERKHEQEEIERRERETQRELERQRQERDN